MALEPGGRSAEQREAFLAALWQDADLQGLLADPRIAGAAVAVARAAGFPVTRADLRDPALASAGPAEARGIVSDAPRQSAADEEETIDFDGDGVPDAVRKGAGWSLRGQEEW